jgi:hypothetical protein
MLSVTLIHTHTGAATKASALVANPVSATIDWSRSASAQKCLQNCGVAPLFIPSHCTQKG